MLLDEINTAVHNSEFEHARESKRSHLVTAPVQPEARSFGLPTIIWGSMAASYALFFAGLLLGTGHDGRALFMIVISVLYALMYFGTAFVLNGLGQAGRRELPSQWVNGKFQTFTGPMSFGSVFAQMLVVPIMFAVFGITIAIIRFVVV